MGSATPFALIAISVTCYILGLAGIIAGCYGDAWLVLDVVGKLKEETGLWRTCIENIVVKKICVKRKDLFEFEAAELAKDTILSVLIAVAVFGALGLFSILLLICNKNRRRAWKCSAVVSAAVGFVAACGGFGALGYSEFEFATRWNTEDHGWSVLVAWVGSSAFLVAAIISLMLHCVLPTQSRHKQTVHYVGNTNSTYQGDYQMR